MASGEQDEGAPYLPVAYEDLGDVWRYISKPLRKRLPLRGVTVRDKLGKTVENSTLNIRYVPANDAQFVRLRPYEQHAVTWFRQPFTVLVLVTGEDVEEYRRATRPALKAALERQTGPLGPAPDFLIAYVRPLRLDPLARGPSKLFAALQKEWRAGRRERCVRLDPGPGAISVAGLDELERALGEAARGVLEARVAAYEDKVRQLMAARQGPGWQFSTLFLVKDALAAMLEAASLLRDALREYAELEAVYLEALDSRDPAAPGPPFGGTERGAAVATLLRLSWRDTRAAFAAPGAAEFHCRQCLFACQARLLIALGRAPEVARRGLRFVATFAELLGGASGGEGAPPGAAPLLGPAWTFSACLALAALALPAAAALQAPWWGFCGVPLGLGP